MCSMETISFDHLLQNHAFSDFKLFVNGEPYFLHRPILFCRSNFFRKIFTHNSTQCSHELLLPPEHVASVDIVLQWIYSGTIEVSISSFASILRIAVIFQVESLLDRLIPWMKSNFASNIIDVYLELGDLEDSLPALFFTNVFNIIIKNFDMIQLDEFAKLPENIFLQLLLAYPTCEYQRGASIANYILKNPKSLGLVSEYVKNGWPLLIDQLMTVPQIDNSLLTPFACTNFPHFTSLELARFPHSLLLQIIGSDELNAKNEEYMMAKIGNLTSFIQNKVKNRQIWQTVVRDGRPRVFPSYSLRSETVRVLVLGSVYSDILKDNVRMISKCGIRPSNIAIFDGDVACPSLELLFKFDVVFAFTHYQFCQAETLSDRLADFVSNGGGLVVAYGFFRADEWGCGHGKLMEHLPFNRSETCQLSNHSGPIKTIDHPLTSGLGIIQSGFVSGQIAPRAKVVATPGSDIVAWYCDGIPLIGIKKKVVGLNIYPISNEIHHNGLPDDQPAADLFGKACLFVSGCLQ